MDRRTVRTLLTILMYAGVCLFLLPYFTGKAATASLFMPHATHLLEGSNFGLLFWRGVRGRCGGRGRGNLSRLQDAIPIAGSNTILLRVLPGKLH